MKRLIVGIMLTGLVAATVAMADEAAKDVAAPAAAPAVENAVAAPAAAAAEKPAAEPAIEKKAVERPVARHPMMKEEDVTVTGKLEKFKYKRPGAENAEPMVAYVLTEASGQKVRLPYMQKNGEAAAIDLGKYAGKEVKITGKGRVLTMGERKHVSLHSIESVEEVAAAKSEAPGAPVAEKPAAPEAAKPAPALEAAK